MHRDGRAAGARRPARVHRRARQVLGRRRRAHGSSPAGSPRVALQQRHLPNVPLVTHDGEQVRFYDDLVKDKKVVLTFVSSRAPAESNKVTRNLAAIQRLFGARVGQDLFLYSIARTPERDIAQSSTSGPFGAAPAPAGSS